MTDITPELDTKALRHALGQFATGVTVITAKDKEGTPRGFTANSFTSVSLEPPLVLVCIAKAAASCDVFTEASDFAINILGEEQKDISGLFATQRPDKFDAAQWKAGANGAPLIEHSLAWFECCHHQVVDAGDHVILIGRVTTFDHRDAPPLGYFRGNYFSLAVENSLVEAMGREARLIIGAIFEKEESLLLEVDQLSGEVRLPCSGKDSTDASVEQLRRQYAATPLNGTLEFIYSVYEDRRSGSVTLYYRGHASGDAPAGMRFFAFDDIPWDQLRDSATNTMLRRYVHEARTDRFAIYVGDETAGDVRTVE